MPLSPPPWGFTQTKETNTMTTKHKLTKSDLMYLTCPEIWYRHPTHRSVLYTDGARYVAEHGRAYWLLDEIASIQPCENAEDFQIWKLTVRPDRTAVLTCDAGDGTIVFAKEIEYTDFPLDEITFYFTENTILLPSEH